MNDTKGVTPMKEELTEQEKKREEEKKKKKEGLRNRIILILLLIVALLVVLKFCDSRRTPISPDYPPQGYDDNQQPIDGDTTNKMDSEDGGGAINVTYQTEATVSLSENTVSLYYANPNASNQNVAVLVMIDDLVVAKSDLIKPGHEIRELELSGYAKGSLQLGGYQAEIVVRAYNPETGEKAMVDTRGQITLTVEN